jgi:hypothetical protein
LHSDTQDTLSRLFVFGRQISNPLSLRSRSGFFRRRPSTNHLAVRIKNSRLIGALPKQELIEPGSMDARRLDFCNHKNESDTSM